MRDAHDILNVIKRAALEAVNASQPSDFYFGKVTSIEPLKIAVEQKMTLGAAQLILTRNVTDYKIKVSMEWETEAVEDHNHYYSGNCSDGGSCSGTTDSDGSHKHKIVGKKEEKTEKELTIHNALKVDDIVILLKKKGGQKYLVLDRVVEKKNDS